MTTSNLRSTAAISEYLCIIDSMAVAAETLKSLQRREKEIRDEVLGQIGDRRSVMYCNSVRTLKRADKTSFSLVVDEAEAVAYCHAHGIPTDTRAPEYLSGAKRTKYGREQILPPEILEPSVETIVIVD